MSSRSKARVVGTVLLLVAFWPLAHRQLVTRFDVNPWKLYGFAMYCTPHDIAVDLIDRSGAAPTTIEVGSLPAPARASFARFGARRRTLGTLHAPDELAQEVFAARPETRRLTIAVTLFSLRWGESSITHRSVLHHFDRGSFD